MIYSEVVVCPNCGSTVTADQPKSQLVLYGKCRCGKDILVIYDSSGEMRYYAVCEVMPSRAFPSPEASSITDAEKLKAIEDYLQDEVLTNLTHAVQDVRAHALMVEDKQTGKEFLDQTMTLSSIWLDLQIAKRGNQMAQSILGIIQGGQEK